MKAACAKCTPISQPTSHSDLSLFPSHQLKVHNLATSMDSSQDEQAKPIQPNIDPEKLQQAIMSFKQVI